MIINTTCKTFETKIILEKVIIILNKGFFSPDSELSAYKTWKFLFFLYFSFSVKLDPNFTVEKKIGPVLKAEGGIRVFVTKRNVWNASIFSYRTFRILILKSIYMHWTTALCWFSLNIYTCTVSYTCITNIYRNVNEIDATNCLFLTADNTLHIFLYHI